MRGRLSAVTLLLIGILQDALCGPILAIDTEVINFIVSYGFDRHANIHGIQIDCRAPTARLTAVLHCLADCIPQIRG
jgi:hypothetical protein